MQTIFALVDCNNFFVSCERLFRPDLEGRPVVVLSSNDGCAVSRSNEAKTLGIPMGAPAFKWRQFFKDHGVVQFSANFELYGDISHRIIRLLTGITPRTEVYSVDEAFLDLSELKIKDYQAWGRAVRSQVFREVGVPVSLGIAPSKTLAKLASDRSKKLAELGGVLDFINLPEEDRALYLRQTPINDVWGVGWRLTPRLRAEGLYNALDLSQLAPQRARQLMGIHGRQMVAELSGLSCHPLEVSGRTRQSVMKGRMFGRDTNDFTIVEAAIASLTARATKVLRHDGLVARQAAVSLSTNKHKPGYQRRGQTVRFDTPTADTGLITAALVAAAREIHHSAIFYHRAAVLLWDFQPADRLQPDLLGQVDVPRYKAAQARAAAFDAIVNRYGPKALHYAAEDLSDAWRPRHYLGSPRYTTNWDELPVARLKPYTT